MVLYRYLQKSDLVLVLSGLFVAALATSLPKEIDGAALVYVAVLFVRNNDQTHC